jgi:hypothetical protein
MVMLVGFDVDGTVADLTQRRVFVTSRPKNWPAFYAGMAHDDPIHPVIAVARSMRAAGHVIFFASGREGSHRHRSITVEWLAENIGPWTRLVPLFMRRARDYRRDDVVKEEILDQEVIPMFGQLPDIMFDDRNRVVEMWRRRGIICAQVAEGDF